MIWDVEEFKVWPGLDPDKPQWHPLNLVCQTWDAANGLIKYIEGNKPEGVYRAVQRADLVAVPREFIEFVRNAPVSSGFCCCGDAMDKHGPFDGHAPTDQWEYSLHLWLEQIGYKP